jgi:hypothetical protein
VFKIGRIYLFSITSVDHGWESSKVVAPNTEIYISVSTVFAS